MKFSRAGAVLLTFAAVGLGGAVDRAAGATTEIGAVDEIRAAALPSPIAAGGFAVQVAEATGTYAVPPGYGAVSAWSHSAGTTAGTLTFKVYRPTGAKQEFLVVGSDTRTVTPGTVQTFPVQIRVRPGDRIGLSSDDVELAYESSNAADRIGFFGSDPPLAATEATDGEPFEEFKLDVAATLEPAPSGRDPAPSPAGGSPSAVAPRPPAVAQMRIAPRTFRAAPSGPSARTAGRRRSGAAVSYDANVPAKVRFTVRRAGPGRRQGRGSAARCVRETRHNRAAVACTREMPVGGGFAQKAGLAANLFRFTGRLGGRTLRPGGYRLVATPTASGRTGKPVSRSFRIIP